MLQIFPAARKSRNIGSSQQIDCRLHHHRTNGGDGKLKAHRKTHHQKSSRAGPGKSPFALPDLKNLIFLLYIEEAGHSGNDLGDDGGISRSPDAQRNHGDEHDIQNDIQHRRNDQEDQRGPAVS